MSIALKKKIIEAQKTFERWGHEVSGWFTSAQEVEAKPGVFVVATQGFLQPFVLDVDQADNLRHAIENHERKPFWKRNALGAVMYSAIYTETLQSRFLSAFEREKLVDQIRAVEEPVCRVMG